jgi:hypothetical protein
VAPPYGTSEPYHWKTGEGRNLAADTKGSWGIGQVPTAAEKNTGLVVLANAGGKIVKGKILAARKTKNGGQKKQGRLWGSTFPKFTAQARHSLLQQQHAQELEEDKKNQRNNHEARPCVPRTGHKCRTD